MKYTRKFLFCVQIAQIPFVFVQNKGNFARYVPFQPEKSPLSCSVKIVTKRKQFPYKVLCGYYPALQFLHCGAVAERVPVKGGTLRPCCCFCVRFRKFTFLYVDSRYFTFAYCCAGFFSGQQQRFGGKARGNVSATRGCFSFLYNTPIFVKKSFHFQKSRPVCVLCGQCCTKKRARKWYFCLLPAHFGAVII